MDITGELTLMSTFRLCLLGGFRLARAETEPTPGHDRNGRAGPVLPAQRGPAQDRGVPSGQARRLLAYLGIHGEAPRAEVAGVLWPDVNEARAMGSLRTTLWRLHRATASGEGLVASATEMLALHESVRVDVRGLVESALLLGASEGARSVPESGAESDSEAGVESGSESGSVPESVSESEGLVARHGDRVLAGGELLPGWYDEWVLHERERLRQLRLHALEGLSALLVEQRRHVAALEAAFIAVRLEPLRESAHRAVVAVHVAEGNVCEAIRHYDAYRVLLDRELGVEPSERLVGMLPPGATIGRPDPSPLVRATPGDVGVTAR